MKQAELMQKVYDMQGQIKSLRLQKGLQQKELANISGVSKQTISAIENNKTEIRLGTWILLTETLKNIK